MTEGIFTAPHLRVRERHGESRGIQLPAREWDCNAIAALQSGQSCAFIVIANFAHLRTAYGLPFALCVSHEIKSRICRRLGGCEPTDLVCLRDDCFLLRIRSALVRHAPHDAGTPSEALENLLAALCAPVRAHGLEAVPHVHADWIPVPDPDLLSGAEIELLSWACAAQFAAVDPAGSQKDLLHRADMATAVRVYGALAAGRQELGWQPVVDAHAAAATFYREACVRFEAADDETPGILVAGDFMQSLERLGLARLFDRQIARAVVEALRLQPAAVMAVRISAQSATLDHWWASLLRALADDAAVARRLIVEIGGGAALASLASAREFCAQLRRCGCRVAIGNFGAGAIRLEGLLACRPDIVKLDASLVRNARDDESARDTLLDMLAMCGRVASHIVVDGIDGESDLQIALQAGARWMQGYYLGSPDLPSRRCRRPQAEPLPAAQAEAGMLLPDVLALAGACALASASLVLAVRTAMPLSALGLWSCGVGVALERAVSGASLAAVDALQRPSRTARIVIALLGISSGLAAGSLMSGQFAAALCIGAATVLGFLGGALCRRVAPDRHACPRALRRMQLPSHPACDPAARALACAELAARLLRPSRKLPQPTVLRAYMDGLASGFYGLGSSGPQPEDAGVRAPQLEPSMLRAIWRVGAGHGGRIRSEQAGGAR